MSLIASAINVVERAPLPDRFLRFGVGYLVGRTRERLSVAPPASVEAFSRDMTRYPIAIHTSEANAQHYEVPARFFELTLGPRRKYSCCYYDRPDATLAEAELRALEETRSRSSWRKTTRVRALPRSRTRAASASTSSRRRSVSALETSASLRRI